MTYSEKIVEARKGHSLSQRGLAKKIGVAQSSVAGWESGRTMPQKRHLLKIIKTLNLEDDYFKGCLFFKKDTIKEEEPVSKEYPILKPEPKILFKDNSFKEFKEEYKEKLFQIKEEITELQIKEEIFTSLIEDMSKRLGD